MQRFALLLLALALGLLAACGSTQSVSEPANLDDADLLTNLPEQIDVNTAAKLHGRDDVVFVDVREQWEYDDGHIPDITLIPLGEVANRVSEIPTDKTVVLTCRSGNRSNQAYQFLQQNGFDNVHNMQGGIIAWEAAGHTVEQ